MKKRRLENNLRPCGNASMLMVLDFHVRTVASSDPRPRNQKTYWTYKTCKRSMPLWFILQGQAWATAFLSLPWTQEKAHGKKKTKIDTQRSKQTKVPGFRKFPPKTRRCVVLPRHAGVAISEYTCSSKGSINDLFLNEQIK